MKNKILGHFVTHIVCLFFFLFYPIKYNTISISQIGMVAIGLLGIALIGGAILSYSKSITNTIVFWMLSYIIGGIFIGSLSSILSTQSLIIVFVVLCFISLWILYKRTNHIKQLENNAEVIPLIISTLIIFSYTLISDINQAQNSLPFQAIKGLPDPFFFTLITQSISVNHIFDAYYDTGAAINYQIISFLPPAFFTKLFGIPAQVSLWGIWMPAYKLFSFILVGYAILKNIKITYQHKWWSLPIIIFLLITLAPINPKYLINFDISKIVFLGTGYLLPGGNPPFSLAIAMMGTVLLLFKQNEWGKFDGILFTCLLALIIGTKTAIFIPLGIFIGILAMFKYKDSKKPFIYTICSAILAGCIYILLFGNANGMIKIEFNPGYYIESFNQLLHTKGYFRGSINMITALIIWGGIRFGILSISIFKNIKNIPKEIIAIGTAMLFTILLPLLLRLKLLAPNGAVLQDISFDLEQFLRATFFLLTIVAVIILFNIRFKTKKRNQLAIILISIYCTLTFTSNAYRFTNKNIIEDNNSWRVEVRKECPKDGLFAMSGNRKYSPQLLAAEGIGPWWFTCKRGDRSGYITTNKNYYRAIIMDKLINNNPEIQLEAMRREGVTYIIAHPENIDIFEKLKQEKLVYQNDTNKWLFKLNEF